MRGNRFAAAYRPETFASLRFDTNSIDRHPQDSGKSIPNRLNEGREPRPLSQDDGIDVTYLISARPHECHYCRQQLHARGARECRIAVRKVCADVAKAGSSEQRITYRVCEGIGVRMAHKAFFKRDLDASKDQLSALGE